MVFELLGRTLLHEIQDRGALEVSETKRCAACLLECLAFVHDEVGVLHTDVKPENVLLAGPAPVGRVKLVDLGTAFYVGRQGARDIQTREYRCPEGVLGLWPFGPAADVWSVGCLVFELLTGGQHRFFGPAVAAAGRALQQGRVAPGASSCSGPCPPSLVRRSPRAARWFRGDGSALRNIAIGAAAAGRRPPGACCSNNPRPRAATRATRPTFTARAARYEPDARVSARRALDLPWLADGGDLVL